MAFTMARPFALLGLMALCGPAACQNTTVELVGLPRVNGELSPSIIEVMDGLTTYDLACAPSASGCDLVGHATCVMGETTFSATATNTESGDGQVSTL